RDDRYHDDPIRSLGLKIEIPEFIGKVHPNDFIDWLSTIERVFDVQDIPDQLKVKIVAIKLRKHASLWWDHVNKRQQIKVKTKNMTMKEVINEFDKLRMRCGVVEKEEQVVAWFLGVLKPEIADIAKSKGSTSRFTPPTRTAPLTTPETSPKATTPTTSAAGNTRKRVGNVPRCYKCGGLGHFACDCPNLKTLALVSDDASPIYDTDAEPEVDEPGDELVYSDRGEALVIPESLKYRDDRYHDDPIRSLGLKIEIPEFIGKVHPNDFIDWLSTIERVFDVQDIPDQLKVKIVAIKLRKHASLWWDHVNKRQQIKVKTKNMTMKEVINEFDKLRMRCGVVEKEEQVVAWFLGVLKPEIADIVSLQGPIWMFVSEL
nr:hypothetical protein [Tanacetum cinerariifolium]